MRFMIIITSFMLLCISSSQEKSFVSMMKKGVDFLDHEYEMNNCTTEYRPEICNIINDNKIILKSAIDSPKLKENEGDLNKFVKIACNDTISDHDCFSKFFIRKPNEIKPKLFDHMKKHYFIEATVGTPDTGLKDCQITCKGQGTASPIQAIRLRRSLKNDALDDTRTMPHNNEEYLSILKKIVVLPECKITFKDRRIYLEECRGSVEVRSVMGTDLIPCRLISDHLFFGQVFLKTDFCESVIKTNEFCVNPAFDETVMSLNCDNKISSATVAYIVVILFSIFLIYIVLRYIYLVKYLRMGKFFITESQWTDKMLCIKMCEVRDDVNKAEVREGVSILNGKENVYRSYRLKIKHVILFMLLIFRTVDSQMLSTKSDWQDLSIDLDMGESLTIGNGSMILKDNRRVYPLVLDYHTMEMSSEMASDYHCYESICNKELSCDSHGIFGIMSGGNNAILDRDSNVYIKDINYCSWGFTRCPFTLGCWRWSVRLTFHLARRGRVFTIGQGHDPRGVSWTDDFPCDIAGIHLEQVDMYGLHTVVRMDSGEDFICPMDSNKGSPSPGSLGDFQFNSNGSFIHNPSQIMCTSNHGQGPFCTILGSAIPKVLSDCTLLPVTLGEKSFAILNDQLVVKMNNRAKVALQCPRGMEISKSNDSCGGLEIHVFGVENTGLPVSIIYRPRVRTPGMLWSGKLPCSEELITMQCTSSGVIRDFTWPNECIKTMNVDSIKVIDVESMRMMEHSTIRSYDVAAHEDSDRNSFWNFFKSWLGIGLTSSPVLIIIIGVLLIRK